jgi:hypothetical protein
MIASADQLASTLLDSLAVTEVPPTLECPTALPTDCRFMAGSCRPRLRQPTLATMLRLSVSGPNRVSPDDYRGAQTSVPLNVYASRCSVDSSIIVGHLIFGFEMYRGRMKYVLRLESTIMVRRSNLSAIQPNAI